jgi:hypothetical protein
MSLNDRQKEKIRRQLYKQEKQKEEEEKLKYPAINGLINERNIFKFFIFDDDEKNNKKNDYIKLNNQINYDINSYLNNEELPDLYTPLGMIKGDSYKIIPYKESKIKNDKREIKNNIENNNIDNFNYKTKKKIKRYFDIDFDEENDDIKKVSKKKNVSNLKHTSCKKCGSKNSLKCDCLTIRTFCYICLGKTHIKKNCPRLQKCFKCLKYGHKTNDCNEDLNNKCENCNISIHKKEECLKNPDRILIKDLKENNLKCRICGSEEHLICKFYNREDIILDFNSNDKDKSNYNLNKSYASLNNSYNYSNLDNIEDNGRINISNCFSSWENGTEEPNNTSYSIKNEFNNSYINTNLSTINSNINDYNNSEYNTQNNDKKGSNYNNFNINNYNNQYYNYSDKNINNDNYYRKRSIHNNNEKGNNHHYNNYIPLKEDNEDREYGSNSLYNEYYNNKYNHKGYNNKFGRDNYNYTNNLYESYKNYKKQKYK